MIDVVIHGWNVGMNTIESARILRHFLGLGLADAKTMVESIVDNRELQLQLPDLSQAEAFLLRSSCRWHEVSSGELTNGVLAPSQLGQGRV